MGAVLDSPENIRQRAKSPSRKAHCRKEKLEKDKAKGVNMQSKTHGETIPEILANRVVNYMTRYGLTNETYFRLEQKLAKIVDQVVAGINESDISAKIKEFKRVAFYEKKDNMMLLTQEGIEEKTSTYLGNIQRIFKNGSH